jgi:type IV pilus assembly protein PilO
MAGFQLDNKPWHFAAILGAIVVAALIWTFETYVFADISKDIKRRTVDLDSITQKVHEGKVAEGRLANFRADHEMLQTELQRLVRILPTAKQTDELIKKIKSLTDRGDFRIVSVQPQNFIKREFYSEWPIGVALEANYHELAMFFDRLSKFSRIINVDSLQLLASTRRNPAYTVSSTFTMKTFVYGDVQPGGPTP